MRGKKLTFLATEWLTMTNQMHFFVQYDIACSRRQSIWQLKTILIERNADLRENGLNYGIFCFPLGHFLDEQLTFADYFVSGKSNGTRFRSGTIRLEFLYKQRIKYGEVMSTLPIGE